MSVRVMVLAACCWIAVSVPSFAQRTPPTPADEAQRNVQRYTALLALTSSQQEQALTIFTAEATSSKPLREAEQPLRTTLSTAVTTDNTAAIAQAALSLGELSGQLTSLSALSKAELYQLLTSEQQARFAASESSTTSGPPGPGGFSR